MVAECYNNEWKDEYTKNSLYMWSFHYSYSEGDNLNGQNNKRQTNKKKSWKTVINSSFSYYSTIKKQYKN